MKHLFIYALLFLGFQAQSQDYFQQEVHYTINVTLDDKAHTLEGDIVFDYHNESSDELTFIWVHLWPNAYKNNQTAMAKQNLENGDTDFYYSKEKDRGYINELDFHANGKPIRMEYHPDHIDICKIILNEPLRSGDAVRISTPFFVKIPAARFSRLGHLGESYMITQWYPKPAVYDQNGWHEMPYLSQGEFYSEFGSFDVRITVPKNYTVGATGDLQNQLEINRLNTLAEETAKLSEFGTDMTFPRSDKETKTLQYLQKDIHDFAWFADKRFHVLKGEVELPHNKEKVTTWAMFTNNEANLWKNAIEYLNDGIYYYSLWNGDYPYKQCTAVDGTIAAGGGMEYPNVTVIGESGSPESLEAVIVHEVGHNWFYGILGSNERQHPWMDEGLNSFNESRYMHTKYPDDSMKIGVQLMGLNVGKLLEISSMKYKELHHELLYRLMAAMGKDQEIEGHSEAYTSTNYGCIVYGKTSVVFDYLRLYVGDERFDKAMQIYYEKWKFKHPQPSDLKAILENELQENLDWFFKGLLESQKLIDYSICSHKHGKLKLKNKGKISGPLKVQAIKGHTVIASQWIQGFEGSKTVDFQEIDYDHIRIDQQKAIPEVNRQNNILKKKGLLKRLEPIEFKFGLSYDKAETTEIFYLPTVGWNELNKWRFGMRFYNRILPQSGWQYNINPQYSLGTNQLAGKGKLFHHSYSGTRFLQHLKAGFSLSQYAYSGDNSYQKFSPEISLVFKKSRARSACTHRLNNRYIHIQKANETTQYIDIHYNIENKQTLNPFSINLNLQKGNDFLKSNLTVTHQWDVTKERRIQTRLFAGAFLDNPSQEIHLYHLEGIKNENDYLFEHQFINRAAQTGLASKQLEIGDAFMKFNNGEGYQWITSINTEFPINNHLSIYADAAKTVDNYFTGSGLKLSLLQNRFELYLPLYNNITGFTEWGEIKPYSFRINLKLSLSELLPI